MNMTRNYILTEARWNKLHELTGTQRRTSYPAIRDYVQVRFNGKLMRTWHGDCIKFKTEADHTWFLLLTT